MTTAATPTTPTNAAITRGSFARFGGCGCGGGCDGGCGGGYDGGCGAGPHVGSSTYPPE
jgi:hypothetical protein